MDPLVDIDVVTSGATSSISDTDVSNKGCFGVSEETNRVLRHISAVGEVWDDAEISSST